mgnify:CR=1 FL=1
MQELELDHHMETSALTGHNISNLFETLTKHLYLENNNIATLNDLNAEAV